MSHNCYAIVGGDLHHLQRPAWLVARTKKRTMEQCSQRLKNNAAAGYQVPVKIKLLKGAGLLNCSYQQRKWSKTYSAAATLTLNNRQETLRRFGRACHCVYFGSRIRSSPRMYHFLEEAYHQGSSILPCNAKLLMLYF